MNQHDDQDQYMDFDPGYVSSPSPGPSFAGEETFHTDSSPAETGVAKQEKGSTCVLQLNLQCFLEPL